MWLVWTLSALCLFLAIVLYTARTQRNTRVRFENRPGLGDIYPSLEHLTRGRFTENNSVEILQNGDGFFPVLLEEFAAAKHHIHFQSYVWWKGDICNRLCEVLSERARAGVEVRVLLDAFGSFLADDDLLEGMREAGVELVKFHPFELKSIGRINSRNHRKCAIVDAEVAFVMAHGVAKEWEGAGDGPESWRDTGARLRGPIVNEVQGSFCTNWMEACGYAIVGQEYFREQPAAGDLRCQIIASQPKGGVSDVSVMLKIMLSAADEEILIQNPYFCPDDQWLEMLTCAVEQGVDVRLMVPGKHNDSKLIRWAGRHQYGKLLKAGVRIFRHERTLIHQKIMIVDRQWSHIGSTNFDERSFDINAEISLGIDSTRVAEELREQFFADAEYCTELTWDDWSKRPFLDRVKEKIFFQLHEQL